jgi:hypothetical protein
MSRSAAFEESLSRILDRYLDIHGNIDYFALMGDQSHIKYAEALATVDLTQFKTHNERLAFWINAYNALSIYGVVKKLEADPEYAKRGNKNWLGRVRFFAIQKFIVAGKKYTLRSIENWIRKEFKEPRIHFALNCSSLGCPVLKDGLYSAENLDAELDVATKLYLNSPSGVQIDSENRIVHLSMIFKWYKNDFKVLNLSILEFVAQYLSEVDQTFIRSHHDQIKIKYIPYNWSLNLSTGNSD